MPICVFIHNLYCLGALDFYIFHRLLMSSLFYANRIYCDTIYLKVCLKDIYVQKCVLNVFQTNSVMCMHAVVPTLIVDSNPFFCLFSPELVCCCCNLSILSLSTACRIRAPAEEQQWTSVVLSPNVVFFLCVVGFFLFLRHTFTCGSVVFSLFENIYISPASKQ